MAIGNGLDQGCHLHQETIVPTAKATYLSSRSSLPKLAGNIMFCCGFYGSIHLKSRVAFNQIIFIDRTYQNWQFRSGCKYTFSPFIHNALTDFHHGHMSNGYAKSYFNCLRHHFVKWPFAQLSPAFFTLCVAPAYNFPKFLLSRPPPWKPAAHIGCRAIGQVNLQPGGLHRLRPLPRPVAS